MKGSQQQGPKITQKEKTIHSDICRGFLPRYSAQPPEGDWPSSPVLREAMGTQIPEMFCQMFSSYYIIPHRTRLDAGVVCSSISTFISHQKKSQGLSQSWLRPRLLPLAPPTYALAQSATVCFCPRTQFVVRGMFPHPVEEGPGALSSLKGSANWNPIQLIRDEVKILLENS